MKFASIRILAIAAAVAFAPTFVHAQSAEIHMAPDENLEAVDVSVISSARESVDIAAFVLSDRVIIGALNDAVQRGVKVRVVLDPTQKHSFDAISPRLDVRVKLPGPYMHLKGYAVDGVILRTGSANFSMSALRDQDNDLVVMRDQAAARTFERKFNAVYAFAVPLEQAVEFMFVGGGSRQGAAGYGRGGSGWGYRGMRNNW